MNRPNDAQLPPSNSSFPAQVPLTAEPTSKRSSSSSTSSSLRTAYLILYNAISAGLWAVTLGRTIGITAQEGYGHVFWGLQTWVRWTQTLALLEVVHCLVGLVRAPILTTAMQVASRLLLVWGIAYPFPTLVAANPAYTSMLLAWSATEVVRYSYFVNQLAVGRVEGLLLWARYNAFFVLYPLGIGSECWLVYSCLGAASEVGAVWGVVLGGVLAVYVPGSYILFTHMMAQRRKVLRGSSAATTAKKTR